MCLKRLRQALCGQFAYPDAFGVVFELAAALGRASASLGACESRAAQDHRQVAAPAAGASAVLPRGPAGPSGERLVQ